MELLEGGKSGGDEREEEEMQEKFEVNSLLKKMLLLVSIETYTRKASDIIQGGKNPGEIQDIQFILKGHDIVCLLKHLRNEPVENIMHLRHIC